MRRLSLSVDVHMCSMLNVITETRNFSENWKKKNVNIIIRSRKADKFEQVEYLRPSVVQKSSKA